MLEGIQIKCENQTHAVKICQLADDTTLFSKYQNEITTAFRIIDELRIQSGLQLNKHKTEGLWLGRLKKTIYMLITSFSKDFIKTVGIYFEHNHELCSRLNWETKAKVTQVKQQLNRWEMHNPTFYWKKTEITKNHVYSSKYS